MLGDYWDDATMNKVIELLPKYQDLFPTKITKLKGILGDLGMMKVNLKITLNPKYKEKVREELDKILAAGIIEPMEESDWVSPMIVVKQLRITLGHIGYDRKIIKGYAQITAPMEHLLKKYTTYCWNDDCKKCLDILKEKMSSAPILVFPKWDIEFHVHVDASRIALGAILTQEGVKGIDHLITFAIR
eukprot:PITA_05731